MGTDSDAVDGRFGQVGRSPVEESHEVVDEEADDDVGSGTYSAGVVEVCRWFVEGLESAGSCGVCGAVGGDAVASAGEEGVRRGSGDGEEGLGKEGDEKEEVGVTEEHLWGRGKVLVLCFNVF